MSKIRWALAGMERKGKMDAVPLDADTQLMVLQKSKVRMLGMDVVQAVVVDAVRAAVEAAENMIILG
ncbi:MAG: hypothetical protein AAF226_16125 [Verrucomicrobiota bacterium]